MNEHDRHTTGAIAEALTKVQAELPKLERDRTVQVEKKSGGTYSYSYVTLANLNEAVLPLLAKHGLAFAAMPGAGADGKMSLRYALLHDSGERLEGEFPISGEGGIQMVGGRITYVRRYVLAALVGVAADEDDESRLADTSPGTAQRAAPRQAQRAKAAPASERTAQRASAPPPLPSDGGPAGITITSAQLQKLAILAKELELGLDRDAYLGYLSKIAGRDVKSSKELTKREAHQVIEAMEQDRSNITAAEPESDPNPQWDEPTPDPAP